MKIAFTGPESSGKTSLSKKIAHSMDATWFPEYAREYLLQKKGRYSFEDIEKIAVEQENQRKAKQNGLNIYDTENCVLYIWSLFNYQKCSPLIQQLLNQQQFSHYFLCSPTGVPWEDDPLREHPYQREELFELYKKELEGRNLPFTLLEGSFTDREKKAISIINSL